MEYPRHEEVKAQWERVADCLDRIKVQGGWLYKSTTFNGGVALQFVPNPDDWVAAGQQVLNEDFGGEPYV
jgi:hypothetical protein